MFISEKLYENDIISIASSNIKWSDLKNKNILITGATGLIGTFLIDLLMYRNIKFNDCIKIYAIGRNKEKAIKHFKNYINSQYFMFIQQDIIKHFDVEISLDYIIHGASNTHPIAYANDPINTILLSVLGTKNILDLAVNNNVTRTLFISTVEIYGENRGDVEYFNENYCGNIDCNTLRAGYPEGKRTAEALCQAYIKEKNIDIIIARSCRVFGPTMGEDDSKVIAQFIKNTVNGNNIILKSIGDQKYSYCYVADICLALFVLLLNGRSGEAYNVSNNDNIYSLFEIATFVSEYYGTKVILDIPSNVESTGYSVVTKALLDNSKLIKLGWKPINPLRESLIKTIEILRKNNTLLVI